MWIFWAGNAAHLGLEMIPPYALAHFTCTLEVQKRCAGIVYEPDHVTVMKRCKQVLGSGSTGVRLTALACGCDFVPLSKALDRAEDESLHNAQMQVFSFAPEGLVLPAIYSISCSTLGVACSMACSFGPAFAARLVLLVLCKMDFLEGARLPVVLIRH